MSYSNNVSIWDTAAYGSTSGITSIFINGNNGGITSTFEPIWPESAAYTPLAAAMSTPYIASTDNNDDGNPVGTGARTVRVTGVNTSYAAFSEDLTMDGQTSVNLTTSNVLFINSVTVLTAGSGFTNAGIIRVGTGSNTSGVPAVVHAHMAAGFGRTQTAMYFVPANKTLLLRNLTANSYGVTAAQTVQVVADMYTDPVAGKVLQRQYIATLNQAGTSAYTYPGVLKVPAKTLVMFQALSAASTGPVMFQAEGLLIDLPTSNTQQAYF